VDGPRKGSKVHAEWSGRTIETRLGWPNIDAYHRKSAREMSLVRTLADEDGYSDHFLIGLRITEPTNPNQGRKASLPNPLYESDVRES
jgi:hypothetical protein